MLGELLGLILFFAVVTFFLRAAFDERFFRRHFTGWTERNYSFWSSIPSSLLTGGSEEAYARRTRIAWGIGGVVMAAACIGWAVSFGVRLFGHG